MTKKLNIHSFLGLPRNATASEVETQYRTLHDWLLRENIPAPLRPWAQQQAALIEELYQGYAAAQEEGETEEEVSLEVEERKGVSLWGRARVVLLGVVVGLVILGGILWRTEKLPWPGQQPSPSPTPPAATSPAEFLAGHAERLAELEQTVAQNPQDVEALFELGETYIIGENWEQAIYWFTKLLEVDPKGTYSVHAQTDIGYALLNLGRYPESETAFLKALEMDPNDARTHFNMGFLYAFSSPPNYPEARKHWLEAIRLAPDTELARAAQAHLDAIPGG